MMCKRDLAPYPLINAMKVSPFMCKSHIEQARHS